MERRFSDDEASRIWRRAAELQSARRLPAAGARRPDDAPGDELSVKDIVAIGQEAGIDAAFVEQALTEAMFTPATLAEDAAFRVMREVEGEPAELQAAVQDVATRAPYELRLVDMHTREDTRGLVFHLKEDWDAPLNAGTLAAAPNMVALHVLLRPGSRPGSTEMVLHGEENPTLRRSIRYHDVGFGVFGGIFGGVFGVSGGLGMSLTGGALVASGAGVALVFGGAGMWAIRAGQRWARRRDATTLEQLASEIAGAVRIRRLGGG